MAPFFGIARPGVYNPVISGGPFAGEFAASGDSDAAAYIAAVEAADGQALEQAVKDAIYKFIFGCKADGTWGSIKSSAILAGARTLNGALVPLVGTAPTNFNFVSSDYNRKTGLISDGSTKYLSSNRANNADPQDDNHNSIYVTVAPTAGLRFFMGSDGALTTGSNNFLQNTDSKLYVRNRSADYNSTASVFILGFKGFSRTSSANYTLRDGGTNSVITRVSEVPSASTIHVFDRGPAPPHSPSDARIAFYSIGESIDLALLDARVTTLMSEIDAAINPLYTAAGSEPTLDLNFKENVSLVDDISGNFIGNFSRSTTGTYLASDGLLKTAANNEPRFHHDKDGNPIGFLFEGSSTQYIYDTEDFSGALWTLSAATLANNVEIAPDGAATADKLVATTTQGTAYNRVYQALTSRQYTKSVFAKAAEADEIMIRTGTGNVSGNYISFSLIDGSVTGQAGTAPLNIHVEQYPNGWWRFGVSDNNVTLLYISVWGANCQAGNGIYIWGANATSGTDNARSLISYIKAASGSVTKSSDVYSISGANFYWFDNVNGVGTNYLSNTFDSGPSYYSLRQKSSNFSTFEFRRGFALVVNSSIQAQFTYTTASPYDQKIVLAWQANNFASSQNGSAVLTDLTGSIPSVNQLAFEGHIGIVRRFAYWPQRIANANLEAMSDL